jgi:hypothetical protein
MMDLNHLIFYFEIIKILLVEMNIWQKLVVLFVLIACLFEDVMAAKKQAKKPVQKSKPTKKTTHKKKVVEEEEEEE